MTFIVLSIFIIVLSTFQAATPYFLRKTILFGVTIPEGYGEKLQIYRYKKQYAIVVSTIGLLSFISFLLYALNVQQTEKQVIAWLVAQLVVMFVGSLYYIFLHIRLSKQKAQNEWGKELKQIRVADLSLRIQDEMLPTPIFSIPILITIGLFTYSAMHYSELPQYVPIHWGADGKPDIFREKTLFSAHVNLGILLIMQVMFVAMHYFMKQSGFRISATQTNTSRIRQLAFRKYSSWFLFFINLASTIFIGFFHLTSYYPSMVNSIMFLAIPIAFLLIILLSVGFYAFKIGQGGARITLKEEDEITSGITDFDDDQFWKLGTFYMNKQDPSVFVEKRFGIGWSINFGNWISYVVIVLPVVLIILIAIFI